jgi:hypothetical protein
MKSRLLERALTLNVPETVISRAIELFDIEVNRMADSPAGQAYLNVHKERMITTFMWLYPHLHESVKILELGGKSILSSMLSEFCQTATIHGTNVDLRYPLPINNNQYDLIINTELIEHLKDHDDSAPDRVDRFTYTGVKTCLRECYRILKEQGLMLQGVS